MIAEKRDTRKITHRTCEFRSRRYSTFRTGVEVDENGCVPLELDLLNHHYRRIGYVMADDRNRGAVSTPIYEEVFDGKAM